MRTAIYLFLAALTAAALAAPAGAQWTSDPLNGSTPISTRDRQDWYMQIQHLAEDRNLISWLWGENDPGIPLKQLYQIVTDSGERLLPDSGAAMVAGDHNFGSGWRAPILPDGDGGAVCVFEDHRDPGPAYQWQLFAQRLDSWGNRLWGDEGLRLTTNTLFEENWLRNAARDSAGNFFAAYTSMSGLLGHGTAFVQKFTLNGEVLWGDRGALLCAYRPHQYFGRVEAIRLLPDEAGGVMILFTDTNENPAGEKVRYQHLDADGGMMLPDTGLYVRVPQGMPLYAGDLLGGWPDGEGGSIWAIEDQIGENPGFFRLNAAGRTLWWKQFGFYAPLKHLGPIDVIRHPDGSFWMLMGYVAPGHEEAVLQRVSRDGHLYFGDPGLWTGLPCGSGRLAAAPDGVVFIIGNYEPSAQGLRVFIRAQRRTTAGALVWNGLILMRPYARGNIGACCLGSAGGDGFICVWEDYRNYSTNNIDLYAQRLNADGSIGNPVPPAAVPPREAPPTLTASPCDGGLRIAFTLPQAAAVKLELFDLLGRRLALLDQGPLPAGEHALPWDGGDLPSGVYLLKLTAGGKAATAKAVLVK